MGLCKNKWIRSSSFIQHKWLHQTSWQWHDRQPEMRRESPEVLITGTYRGHIHSTLGILETPKIGWLDMWTAPYEDSSLWPLPYRGHIHCTLFWHSSVKGCEEDMETLEEESLVLRKRNRQVLWGNRFCNICEVGSCVKRCKTEMVCCSQERKSSATVAYQNESFR